MNRAVNLCIKYCDGSAIPDTDHDLAFGLPFDLKALIDGCAADLASCSINASLFRAMEAARDTNKYLTAAEPWKMKGAVEELRRPAIVRTTLEAIYAFTHFLAPVIQQAAGKVFRMLNTPPKAASELSIDFKNLRPGTAVILGDILFQKMEIKKSVLPEGETGNKNAPSLPKPEKKAKKIHGEAAANEEQAEEEANQSDFSKIDLRVGRILKVWNHESADRLFCEEIDVGESVPRLVVSGLRGHYSLEEMLERRVVVVCNLKEAKMQGVVSSGMVLAAKSSAAGEEGRVELVDVPHDAIVGERIQLLAPSSDGEVTAEGKGAAQILPLPWTANRVKKAKIWEAVAADLKTSSNCLACWKDAFLTTSAGPCFVKSVANAPIG